MKKIFFFFVLLWILSLISFLGSDLYALDELLICGRIIKIQKDLITLHISQETCRGERTVKITPELRVKIQKGMVICFSSSEIIKSPRSLP